MNTPPFHEWAPIEIVRHREAADALQRALDLFLAANPPPEPSERAVTFRSQLAESLERTRIRRSKYEEVFLAYELAGRALSIDEMIVMAALYGVTFDRANMRSQIFAQKKAGRAHALGDRYVWGRLKTEPAPPVEEAPDQI